MPLVQERLDTLLHYVNERHRIYLRREAGEPKPWTDDPILQNNRFTNVKRELDRTSQHFKAIYDQHLDESGEVILQNCALYRMFGTTLFADLIGWQYDWDGSDIEQKALQWLEEGRPIFTTAYIVTNNGIALPKPTVVVQHFLNGLWENIHYVIKAFNARRSWQDACERLMQIRGYGGSGFMAKEILLDAMMTPVMDNAIDRDTWTPCGPGGKKGLRMMHGMEVRHGKDIKNQWISKNTLPSILEIMDYINTNKEPHVPELNAHDIQFCLCEISKYIRAVELNDGPGLGRRLRRYKGVENKQRSFF